MATKNFAIPLDKSSKQKGDISFEDLNKAGSSVEFRLTHVTSGGTDQLDLITQKNSSQTNHTFSATVSSGTATVTLTNAQIDDVFDDADGGDWDYIQAEWTVGSVDSGGTSDFTAVQGGNTYDSNGWPPI